MAALRSVVCVVLSLPALVAATALGLPLTAERLHPDGAHAYRHDRPVRFSFAPTAEGRRGVTMDRFRLTVWRGAAVVAEKEVNGPAPEVEVVLGAGRYRWGVQWWSKDGEVSTVAESAVVVSPGDVAWDGVPWLGSDSSNEFQAEVDLKTGRQVELMVATLGFGYVTVNGQEISEDILSYSGWTNTAKRILFRTYDITSLLNATKGGNIFVGLGCGYRCDPQNRFPMYLDKDDAAHGTVAKVFRLQVRVDGRLAFHSGSAGWQTRQGPVTADSVYDGEVYEPAKTTAWQAATPLPANGAPQGAMVPATFPGVQVTRVDQPVKITQPAPGVHVVDFGSNVAGFCSISVRAAATVSLRHGELMQHDHLPGLAKPDPSRVYFDNYRSAQAKDTLILTEPVKDWRPRFTYRGFRFVEVYDFPGQLTADHIQRLRINTALEDKTNLTFADEVLQAIHEGSKGSQRSNLMQIPTDCPQRDERLGWMGDASLSAESMLMHFHYSNMASAFVDSITDELGQDGSLPDVVPAQRFGGRPADLSWSSAFLELVWSIWKLEGDAAPAREQWQHIKQHLSNVQAQYQKAGSMGSLPEPYGDWCPPPQTPGGGDKERSSRGFAAGFSLLSTLKEAAELGAALGGDAAQDAKAYQQLFQQLLAEFHKVHYDATKKQYDNGVMLTYVLPLAIGAVPDSEKAAVFQGLLNHIAAHNNTWTGGIINNKFLFDVLHENGRNDLTLAMLKKKEYPSYGYMYFNDLEPAKECMWELPDAPFQGTGMNSRNHHMFSSIGHYLIRLAGLTQGPGEAEVTAAIPSAELSKALPMSEVSMRTRRGDVKLAWGWGGRDGRALSVEVQVPVGMHAHLHVPQDVGARLQAEGVPAALAPGVKAVDRAQLHGARTTRLVLGSGHYRFEAASAEAVVV